MKDFEEDLIGQYLLAELRANGLVEHEDGVYVFHGQTSDYMVEINVMRMGREVNRTVRLREPFEEGLGYD